MAARMSRTDSELACDERVIHSMAEDQRRDYAGVLVLAACKRDLPGIAIMSTGMSMTGKRLKKRVVSILSNHQAHKGLALCFLLAASMALAGAFATAEAPLIGRIPDAGMEYRASTVAETTTRMTDEEKQAAIEQAKAFWQNEALQADVHDELEWSVQAYMEHVEVHTYDPVWGEALILAFTPEGKILYMNNRRSGDRMAIAHDDPITALSEDDLNKVKEYAFAVLEAIEPGVTDKFDTLENLGASKYNDNYFYRFRASEGKETASRENYVFVVQVYPEVRLTHFENLLELNDEASDRLEPGNG